MLKWISNFIRERYFSVKIVEQLSSPRKLYYGVPQGSILSPIIFAIYLLPLSSILNTFPNVHYIIYAVDIELHYENKNSTELQLCMDTIHNWLTSNHLQLNATTTELLNINANSNFDNFPILYIDSSPLTPSSTVKYLGITLNPTLDSDDHITSLIKTISHFQYNIRKIRPFIDFPMAKLLTHSFVVSRLNYCNTFFIGTKTASITKLDRIINRSIRTIYQLKTTDYTTSVTNLRLQLNWLATTQEINYKTLTLLNKIPITTEPTPIFDDFIYSNNTRLLRSSSTPILEEPPYKFTKFGKKTFHRKATNLWQQATDMTFSIFKKKNKEIYH